MPTARRDRAARPAAPADRRVTRTHRTLREALIALLLERGWDDISVQDICQRADVGRSTFYTHFADKEELLVAGFADLRKMVRAELGRLPEGRRALAFAAPLIAHAHDHRRLFRALVGKRSGQVVLRRFRELVVELLRDDLAGLRRPPAVREGAAQFLAGAFLELLTGSLEAGGALAAAPAEVERLYLEMARPALEAVRR